MIALNLTEFAYDTMVEKLISKSNDVFIINNSRKDELEQDTIPFKILESNNSYYVITFVE